MTTRARPSRSPRSASGCGRPSRRSTSGFPRSRSGPAGGSTSRCRRSPSAWRATGCAAGPRGGRLRRPPGGRAAVPGLDGRWTPRSPTSTGSPFQDLDQSAELRSMTPVAGSFAPEPLRRTSHPPVRRGGRGRLDDANAVPGAAADLATLDVQRDRGRRAHGHDARPDRLDQGTRGEHVGGVEGAVDRIADRDPPPAGAGPDPGRLGVRRLGQPPGRARSGWPSTSRRSTPTSPSSTRTASPPTAAC